VKAREWRNLFVGQARLGKVLFTFTELANASGVRGGRLNVELSRLVKYGVVVRHAKGIYGVADGVVSAEQLLASLDPCAYLTGAYVLVQEGLVTQVPSVITCFTARRHFRREIQTPAGRMEFVCVKPPIYRGDVGSRACAEQALCDWVYLALRRGQSPAGMLTFRRLDHLRRSILNRVLRRYPETVRRAVGALLEKKVIRNQPK